MPVRFLTMVNNNDILPANDPDLLLAQKMGKALPDLDRLKDTDDPLLNLLFSYRKSLQDRFDPVDTSTVWDSIKAEINSETQAKIFHLSPAIKRYAIAAAVLIAVFIGSFVYQNLSGPELIAESFGSIQQVELADGSLVKLRPYSKLYEQSLSSKRAEYRLQGEAYFEVTYNPDRMFSVTTSRAKVEVLGTKFILSDWGNASNVFLREGRIQFEALSTMNSIILEPGQSSTVDEQAESPVLSDQDETVYTDWLAEQLVFQNQPVHDVFRELEQHFNIQITWPSSINEETLTGTVQLDDLDSVLRDLELVLGGAFTQTGAGEYRFNPGS